MKKHISIAWLCLAATWTGSASRATEEPTNFPPSPVNSNSSPYANDPLHENPEATAKPDDSVTKADLDQWITTAVKGINLLQGGNDTRIPNWVVSQARGVIILHRWKKSILAGGSGGWGLGMKKTAKGGFGDPVFYRVEATSGGTQGEASETDTVVFLMSENAMRVLTEEKLPWSGNLYATAGSHAGVPKSGNANVDMVYYQVANGTDVAAILAATKLSVDKSSNRIFYGTGATPDDIFRGNVESPDSVKALTDALNPSPPAASNSP